MSKAREIVEKLTQEEAQKILKSLQTKLLPIEKEMAGSEIRDAILSSYGLQNIPEGEEIAFIVDLYNLTLRRAQGKSLEYEEQEDPGGSC